MSDRARVTAFTATVPHWEPHVAPVPLDTATEEQREALKVTPSNTKVSEYVLVLAHDPESLAARTPLFNAIMYNRGGLSRAERELGAVGASLVNHCIYCAAVHASRYNQLTRTTEPMAAVLDHDDASALSAREGAILRFAEALSACPPAVDAAAGAALAGAGLSAAEALDLVLSAALFGWANRLMHTLGAPYAPAP